ncbi:MAG: ATP-binding protein [Ekhidna sp.]
MGIKRIVVLGPESTGKSELCQHLARHYDTEWVPEYARFYLDRLTGEYQQSDLKSMAEGQLSWEDEKAEYANEYLICDTNLIVIKIWSDHKYGNTDEWIEKELANRSYDFYLLNNIDIPWMPDPQREHPKMRKHFFDIFKSYLEEHNLPHAIVSGIEGERKNCAVDAVSTFFSKGEEDTRSSPA